MVPGRWARGRDVAVPCGGGVRGDETSSSDTAWPCARGRGQRARAAACAAGGFRAGVSLMAQGPPRQPSALALALQALPPAFQDPGSPWREPHGPRSPWSRRHRASLPLGTGAPHTLCRRPSLSGPGREAAPALPVRGRGGRPASAAFSLRARPREGLARPLCWASQQGTRCAAWTSGRGWAEPGPVVLESKGESVAPARTPRGLSGLGQAGRSAGAVGGVASRRTWRHGAGDATRGTDDFPATNLQPPPSSRGRGRVRRHRTSLAPDP